MNDRRKQTEFLKRIIRSRDTEPCRELQEKMAKAQRDENSIRRMVFCMSFLVLFSVTGYLYAALFLGERMEIEFSLPVLMQYFPMPILMKFLSVLGLGAFLCLITNLALWLWQRALLNALHEQCRRQILSILESDQPVEEAGHGRDDFHQHRAPVYDAA